MSEIISKKKGVFVIAMITIITLAFGFTKAQASEICMNDSWVKNINKKDIIIKSYGHSPTWDFEITKGINLKFSGESEQVKNISLTFNKQNNIIFFESKDKYIFGVITLENTCLKDKESYYSTRIVVGGKLYYDEETFITLPKLTAVKTGE